MADRMYISTNPLLPWCHYLSGWTPAGKRGIDPGYDPLAFAIEEAHKRGIELHAWLNPFRYETSTTDRSYGSDDPIRKQHPEWILTYDNRNSDGSVNFNGTILDPGNPEVRAHIVDVVDEIITNYDVDGIIFDDYFYPYSGTNNNEDAISQTRKPAGMTLADWRRDNVNKTIEGVYNKIQEKEPWVRFGISPFGIYSTSNAAHTKYDVPYPADITGMDAYNQIYCDPLAWMQGGYIDYISPQLYWSISPAEQSYTTLAQWWSDRVKEFSDNQTEGKKVHFFSSQRTGLRNGTRQTNDELDKQVGLNRSTNKQSAPGAIFFSYKTTFDSQGVAAYLKTNKFTQQSLPPAMDWKATETLGKPTNVTLNNTTLSWSHADAERFTVYVYGENEDDATAMANPAYLERVVYSTKDANGKKTNAIAVSELGDLTGKKVAVRAYDRYGNEYAAAYYPREEVPTITANKERVDLFAKVGDKTFPAVDVMVTGEFLTGNLTVKVDQINLGHATITKVDWDDKTGGKLRVAITSTAAKASAEGTITISSQGATPCKIPFTAIVDVATPQILVDKSEINLGAVEVNATTRPSADILVSGIDLVQEIEVSSSSAFTITEQAGWDKSKGGKLNIALKSAATAGVYRETITLSSSGATDVYIVVEATVKSEASVSNVPDGPLKGTVSMSKLWSGNPKSLVTANTRSIVYDNGKIYLADQSSQQFHIAEVTNSQTSLPTSWSSKSLGVPTGYSPSMNAYNLCMSDDGQLFSGNSGNTNAITVYAVDKENGGANVYKTDMNIGRSDYFDVYGKWNESGYIVAYSNTGNVAYIPFEKGELKTDGKKTGDLGLGKTTSARAMPYDANSFFVHGEQSVPKKFKLKADGTFEADADKWGESKPVSSIRASGMAIFRVAGNEYMITPADIAGKFDIFDITKGLSSATEVVNNEKTTSLGTNNNTAYTVDFATHVDGYDVYIYVLAPNNGIAAYKFTFTPENVAPTAGIVVRKDQEDLEESAAVALTADQGARPKPYVDVEVKGVELSEDMTIACENPAITWECCAGWDKKTGGWLRITLDTDWAVGTYTEGITITSGSMSRTINVNATINAGAQPKTGLVQGAHTLKKLWDYKRADNALRSISYHNGKLYLPVFTGTKNTDIGKLMTLDASNGSGEKNKDNLPPLGMGGYRAFNLRVTTDGHLLGGNSVYGEGQSGDDIYQHDVDVYDVSNNGNQLGEYPLEGRSDFFYTYGSWKDGGYILALSNGYYTESDKQSQLKPEHKNNFTKINFTNSKITHAEFTVHEELPTGASAKAIPAPDGKSFYATVEVPVETSSTGSSNYYAPTQHYLGDDEKITWGTKIGKFVTQKEADEGIADRPSYDLGTHAVSGLGVFVLHGRTYMLTPYNAFGKFQLFDITKGLQQAKLLKFGDEIYTDPGLGENANNPATIDFCVHVEGDDAYIYMLAPGNGVAAYKFTPSYIFEGSDESNYSWHNPANWSTGMLPDENSNVLILTDCKISDGAGYAKQINIVEGNTLTIAPTGKLTVQEDIQQVANAFATTRSELTGAPDDAALRIEADATGQGVLAYFKNTQTYATVELYGARGVTPSLTGNKDYHIPWEYVAMPFAIENAENTDFRGSWITAWEVPNDVQDYPDQELEAGKAQWVFKEDNDVNLEPWKGYALIQMSPKKYTYGMQGLLQPPVEQTVTLKSHAATTDANTASAGANFIGNSWTAPLKMAKLIEATGVIYLHKNQLSAEGYGEAYDTFTSANVEDEVINPLQGFFVKADKETDVTWNYATLVANGRQPVQNSYRKPAREMEATMSEQLEISVTANNGFYTKVLLCASDAYTTGFDTGYDAHKMLDSKSIPYLAAASGAGDMAILATPDLHGTYLNFSRGSGRSYTLRFSYTGAERLYLVDAVTGISTAIRSGGSYSFTPTANDGYRFRISRKTLEEGALDGLELWAYGRQLYFTNTFGLPTDIWVYGVDGRLVEHRVTQDSQYRLSVPTTGVYVVRVNNEEGTQTMQVIL